MGVALAVPLALAMSVAFTVKIELSVAVYKDGELIVYEFDGPVEAVALLELPTVTILISP